MARGTASGCGGTKGVNGGNTKIEYYVCVNINTTLLGRGSILKGGSEYETTVGDVGGETVRRQEVSDRETL